jgi:hypothetical protein
MAASTTPTIYFGYGSNLWLHQMKTRCPTSTYQGIARLRSYKWIINDRGYANVVPSNSNSNSNSIPNQQANKKQTTHDYTTEVYGLVYSLQPSDEARLDKNEGVPVAYTKELLECDFWASDSTEHKLDTSKPPSERAKKMLVYIDRKRTEPSTPRQEYVYRMNQGIRDAVRLGVPEGYVSGVMRGFIPEEGKGEDEKEMERFARGQAAEFRDESGVF